MSRPIQPPRARWLIPVLVVVVSLTVGGGLLTRELYRQPDRQEVAGVTIGTTKQLPPDQQPGSPAVELTPDAAAHPQDDTVRKLLQDYFDSINGRNYERYRTTVTIARMQAMGPAEWRQSFKTTNDGSILVYRIESVGPSAMNVLVSFTSTQEPSDAPPELQERCIRWSLALPVKQETGSWKVDALPAGAPAEFKAC
ncbi:hypothetical protein [Amycolatopsis minnesotensis]|uniref:Mce-associated membrane protein n=1 Tax=Amycolatopsis minnesotensis TaxID=337894 RepID=A0ABN2SH80_9PSEU